jgi:hypothetical protein
LFPTNTIFVLDKYDWSPGVLEALYEALLLPVRPEVRVLGGRRVQLLHADQAVVRQHL